MTDPTTADLQTVTVSITIDRAAIAEHGDDTAPDAAAYVLAQMSNRQGVTAAHVVPDTPAPTSLQSAADVAAAAADLVMRTTGEHSVTDLDAVDTLRVLRTIREATNTLTTLDTLLVQHAYLTAEHGDTDYGEGLGLVKVARGRNRKGWAYEPALQDFIDAKMEARGGEAPNDPWEVARWVLDLIGPSYVRVTPLRDAGLDPRDYAEESPGKPAVSFLSD